MVSVGRLSGDWESCELSLAMEVILDLVPGDFVLGDNLDLDVFRVAAEGENAVMIAGGANPFVGCRPPSDK